MAIFKRGNVWWVEYRTRKIRVVKSTGLRVDVKENRKKAQAVYDAIDLANRTQSPRDAVENILAAIFYQGREKPKDVKCPLASMQGVYDDWAQGKGRTVTPMTESNRRGLVARFVEWSAARHIEYAEDVSVVVARQFVQMLRGDGLANKTVRMYCQYLAGTWKACVQMGAKLDNPWLAACPDPDGTSIRHGAFTEDEERRILDVARKVGHGWYLASMIARWTGLRYGDVARLNWDAIDWERKVVRVVPSKTRKHGVTVCIPLSPVLLGALEEERGAHGGRCEGLILPEQGANYPRRMKVLFSDVLENAGIDTKIYTFHSWRHTFRTRLAEAGVSSEVARRLGGWTNLEMAAHYDHASHLGEMREAIARMG